MLGFFLGRGLREDDLRKFTGVVLESKTWSETYVSGGGGGGGMAGGAVASTSPVSSTVTTKNQFFLSRDDGGELSVTTSSNLAVRAGTRLVIYGFQPSLKKEFWQFVAYGNVQTGAVALEPGWTRTLSRILPRPLLATGALFAATNFFSMLIEAPGGFLATLAAGTIAITWVAAPIVFIGLWFIRLKREAKVRTTMEKKFVEDRLTEAQKLQKESPSGMAAVAQRNFS